MNKKYLDFTGLSTYDQKIKEYIGNEDDAVEAEVADLKSATDALALENNVDVPIHIAGSGFISYTTGNILVPESTTYSYSDYIDISKYALIHYSRIVTTGSSSTTSYGIAFYDEDKHYLLGTQAVYGAEEAGFVDASYSIRNGMKYIRMTIRNSSADDMYIYGTPKISNIYENENNNFIYRVFNSPNNGFYTYIFGEDLPAGTYTIGLYYHALTDTVQDAKIEVYKNRNSISSKYRIATITIPTEDQDTYKYYTFTVSESEHIEAIRIFSGASVAASNNHPFTVYYPILINGEITHYINQYTAIDSKCRNTVLYPTYDNTDRSLEIRAILSTFGYCKLMPGDYYVSGVVMPEGSTLIGSGDATRLYLLPDMVGSTVTMAKNCSVSDLSMYGASESITLDGNIVGTGSEDETRPNQWTEGDMSIPTAGFKHLVLATPLPAGAYRVSADVTTEATGTSLFAFSKSQTTAISGESLLAEMQFEHSSRSTKYMVLYETAYSVRLCSASSVASSDGKTATFANIKIEAIDMRNGIDWHGSVVQYGNVSNCRIAHFSGAGIYLADTSTPTNHNLLVNNCSLYNNNVGVYIRKDSEFNKIVNCTVTHNWYGLLNRGGNNIITNCGFDSNKVNIQLDADEGDNGGHGSISNCTSNHADSNTGYGLIIRGTGRELVTNCNFYFANILLQSTNGNIISDCGFGSDAAIDINGGSANIICDCMMRSIDDTPIRLTNNTTSKVINCYTRGGTLINTTHSTMPTVPSATNDYALRCNVDGNTKTLSWTAEPAVPVVPSSDGTYVLKCTVEDGATTLAWVAE